ncbi:MAG: rhomboid family intramembrane serine protease [Crocinitomicaceae bacterium]|nr:rhomboid family intramembrane serine protease [Crocinitomicaceae bacterium]
MAQESIPAYIRTRIRRAGIIGQLIAVNVLVFMTVGVLNVLGILFLSNNLAAKFTVWLSAPGDPVDLLYRPWSIITQLFMHANFIHLLFNMIGLYFVGRLFVQFFGEKRLLSTYLAGGIFGYLLHVIGYQFIPYFQLNTAANVVGASGSIFAIFAAVGFYKPGLKVRLFGLLEVPLIFIFLPYLLYEFFSITRVDNVARLAHLGGAIFGGLSIINLHSPKQFMNRIDRIVSFDFKSLFRRKKKLKVQKGGASYMTDHEYNQQKYDDEERTNAILDKISKKGYEGLSKKEKEFLFKQSKKNNPDA